VSLPIIKTDERGIKTLYVDEKPFVCLAGELHNSSSSSAEYMDARVWNNISGKHINTVLLPFSWETIEPEEGVFDFTLVDAIITQAQSHGFKLVPLWFGLWKNAESFYVPDWVKQDTERFFLCRVQGGLVSDSISPLCEEGVKADAKAFAALMAHIREFDKDNTVIMMQVENEIGLIRAERDYGPVADAVYKSEIPSDMAAKYGKSGDWYSAFGEDAPEWFMAYHYAKAVEEIVKAGKAEHNIPMFANAALNNRFPGRPGGYPSGGPVDHMIPVWQLGAPSLDALAPDIYLPYFKDLCHAFTRHGNPLLIPETLPSPVSASNVFYAVGEYNAVCFAPFGLDSMYDPASPFASGDTLSRSYKVIDSMLPLILEHRGTEKMWAFMKRDEMDQGVTLKAQNCDVTITYADSPLGAPGQPPIPRQTPNARSDSGGIVIEYAPNRFYVAGVRFTIKFLAKRGSDTWIRRVTTEEGEFVNGEWKRGRILNGDEGYTLSLGDNAEVKRTEIVVTSIG